MVRNYSERKRIKLQRNIFTSSKDNNKGKRIFIKNRTKIWTANKLTIYYWPFINHAVGQHPRLINIYDEHDWRLSQTALVRRRPLIMAITGRCGLNERRPSIGYPAILITQHCDEIKYYWQEILILQIRH